MLLVGSGVGFLLFGTTLLGREGYFGGADYGIVIVEEVSVRSAPAAEEAATDESAEMASILRPSSNKTPGSSRPTSPKRISFIVYDFPWNIYRQPRITSLNWCQPTPPGEPF